MEIFLLQASQKKTSSTIKSHALDNEINVYPLLYRKIKELKWSEKISQNSSLLKLISCPRLVNEKKNIEGEREKKKQIKNSRFFFLTRFPHMNFLLSRSGFLIVCLNV